MKGACIAAIAGSDVIRIKRSHVKGKVSMSVEQLLDSTGPNQSKDS